MLQQVLESCVVRLSSRRVMMHRTVSDRRRCLMEVWKVDVGSVLYCDVRDVEEVRKKK